MLVPSGSKLPALRRVGLPHAPGSVRAPALSLERISPILLGCCVTFLCCFVAGYFGIWLANTPAQADVLWPANGILLAILLVSDISTWSPYLVMGFLASMLSHRAFHMGWDDSLIFSVANTAEVLLPAFFLHKPGDPPPDLTRWKPLRSFLIYAVILAPVVSAGLAGSLYQLKHVPQTLLDAWNWYSGDALGLAIMTPLTIALRPRDLAPLFTLARWKESLALLLGLLGLSILIFYRSHAPIVFLLFPPLLLVTFRLRIAGGAIGIFLIAVTAAYCTVQGHGPFTLIHHGSLIHSIAVLQFFLGCLLLVVYSVSTSLGERDHLQEQITQAYRRADELATIDHTTGIPNRRSFDRELQREWNRALRENRSISLLMIDIDHFKAYNDHYGHLAGDECLETVATIMSDTVLRETDMVARYGGEEFSVLLPGTYDDGPLMIAERLRNALERAAIPHERSLLGHVSISIGVATVRPLLTLHPSMLVQAADAALYQAKADGRNRVVTWQNISVTG